MLQIGVRQRGCNGLTYTLNYAKEKGKFDEEVVQVWKINFRILSICKFIEEGGMVGKKLTGRMVE